MAPNPFKRVAPVPDDVLAVLPPREKPLAASVARDGTWLVGSRDALMVVPEAGEGIRIPWHIVERADWSRDDERLRVSEVGRYGVARPSYEFSIDEPGLLLELIRERVTASVVLQRRVPLDGRRGLFVIARRPPHGEGEITWAYEFDEGVDPDDPAVVEAAQRGLRAAAEELGL